jgi:hypothetical protein
MGIEIIDIVDTILSFQVAHVEKKEHWSLFVNYLLKQQVLVNDNLWRFNRQSKFVLSLYLFCRLCLVCFVKPLNSLLLHFLYKFKALLETLDDFLGVLCVVSADII